VRRVDDMQQDVRVARFLERRAERGDEVVGQLADESDGVGEAEAIPAAYLYLARERVEGREQPIFDEHIVA